MTSRHIGAAVMAATLTLAALPHLAAGEEAPKTASTVSNPRVRAFDRTALQVLEAAVACSPTVARMVTDLQASDLVVGIEARPFPTKVDGETRIVAAAGGVRHVRIRLQTPNTKQDLMWVLGHELHHATEMAGAPDVRDEASQRVFCLRTGWERDGGGRYETQGAVDAGRLVAREVAGCRAR
ncbi:MAG: hypothetical protein H6Q10_116 [Acidobacteria bacterium]|nr:hypothetical protein [Acidobacteriota bacterium]